MLSHVWLSAVQILGNNECFEPYTSNIYVRRVLSGEFTVVNQHLLSDLTASGLWDADTKNELVAANGSVQVCCWASVDYITYVWLQGHADKML